MRCTSDVPPRIDEEKAGLIGGLAWGQDQRQLLVLGFIGEREHHPRGVYELRGRFDQARRAPQASKRRRDGGDVRNAGGDDGDFRSGGLAGHESTPLVLGISSVPSRAIAVRRARANALNADSARW